MGGSPSHTSSPHFTSSSAGPPPLYVSAGLREKGVHLFGERSQVQQCTLLALNVIRVLVWDLNKGMIKRRDSDGMCDINFDHRFLIASCFLLSNWFCSRAHLSAVTRVYMKMESNVYLLPHTHNSLSPSLPVHQCGGFGRQQERGLGDGSQRPCDKAISPHESSSELTVNTNWCH